MGLSRIVYSLITFKDGKSKLIKGNCYHSYLSHPMPYSEYLNREVSRLFFTCNRNVCKTGKDNSHRGGLIIVEGSQTKVFQIVSLVPWRVLHLGARVQMNELAVCFSAFSSSLRARHCERGGG